MPSPVYIGLGSNLNNPHQQVEEALAEIGRLPGTQLLANSSWYQSSPVGPGDQPDYINGVALIETTLTPQNLLTALQNIENLHGRKRTQRWGARTLDLDILLFGDLLLTSPELTIPHPQIVNRNFVLYPLAEINENLVLPDRRKLSHLLANVSSQGIVRLADT